MKRMYLAAAMLVMISCSKREAEQIENETVAASPVQLPITNDNPHNPANPYDSYGALHNEGMAYVRTKMNAAGETKPEAVTKYVQQYSQLKTGKPDNNDYHALYQFLIKDSANFYAALIARATMCSTGRMYLQSIFSVITKRASSDMLVYSDIKTEIMAIEATVMKDLIIPGRDQKELLKACSLARFSAYYWLNNPPAARSIFGNILAGVVGICSDLSALDPLCGSFLNWMTGGDFDPIGVSGIMYYAM